MSAGFCIRRRVEFSDTDLGGIVHFSRFFVFMEYCEHAYLRSLGAGVDFEIDGHKAGWPRLSASLDFRSPARFEDEIEIELRILRMGRSSLTYGHSLKIGDRLVAEGRISTACCLLDLPEGLKAVAIPQEIADRVVVSEDG